MDGWMDGLLNGYVEKIEGLVSREVGNALGVEGEER